MKKAAAHTAPATTRPEALDRIKTAMIEKKLTQAELADAADCHEKTIQNLLGGRSVRDQTLFDVCMVLGLDFDKSEGRLARRRRAGERRWADCAWRTAESSRRSTWAPTRAPPSTTTSAAILTLRTSFSLPGTIVAYRTDITGTRTGRACCSRNATVPMRPTRTAGGSTFLPRRASFTSCR